MYDCGTLTKMMPLSYDWTALNSKVDAMQPNGNTNVTIGLVWAWHALTSNTPLTEAAAPSPDLDKVIILLTDGDNTEAWNNSNNTKITSQSTIDARTSTACTNIKAANIKIYTVRVIDGNATLLKNCATNPTMYFDVQNASQLNSVFSAIAQNLANCASRNDAVHARSAAPPHPHRSVSNWDISDDQRHRHPSTGGVGGALGRTAQCAAAETINCVLDGIEIVTAFLIQKSRFGSANQFLFRVTRCAQRQWIAASRAIERAFARARRCNRLPLCASCYTKQESIRSSKTAFLNQERCHDSDACQDAIDGFSCRAFGGAA